MPLTEQELFAETYWYRDKDKWLAAYAEYGTIGAMARAAGVSPRVISEWRSRLGIPTLRPGPRSIKGSTRDGRHSETPGVSIRGDEAIVISEPSTNTLNVEELLIERGLEPDDWEVERVVVNEWSALAGRDEEGTPIVVKMKQLKAYLRKKVAIEWIFPATEVAVRHKPTAPSGETDLRLVVVCGDQQAPYQDAALHAAFLRWLAEVQPDVAVTCGDTADFPTISKYRDRPRWSASVQECLDTAFKLLSDYRDASPETHWSKLRGNHDARLESELLLRAERMFGVRPAEVPGAETGPHALSLRRLLHLDQLGIELVGDEEDSWEYGEVRLSDLVAVRHKPPKQVARLNSSIMAGDSHRQSIRFETGYSHGEPRTLALVEVGTLARIREGLGYTVEPNWQQGFATASINAEGEGVFDLAIWRSGKLMWRGEQW